MKCGIETFFDGPLKSSAFCESTPGRESAAEKMRNTKVEVTYQDVDRKLDLIT
jgi:hypothetical protein